MRSFTMQRLATMGRQKSTPTANMRAQYHRLCGGARCGSSLAGANLSQQMGFGNSQVGRIEKHDVDRRGLMPAIEGIAWRGGRESRHHSTINAPPAQQVTSFPSLVIGPNRSLSPQGTFAEAQAAFLDPPDDVVETLLDQLLANNIGIVAHYYMDVELQGVLFKMKQRQLELLEQQRAGTKFVHEIPEFPLVAVADSLKMGDDAVQMCTKSNVRSIICLGVDFMSESVSAIMSKNGYAHVPVYRATTKHIGCSLAESAEGDAYRAWLTKCASSEKKSLHVVYINTSLETKAVSSSIIPTITCTSSNVLQTILQASAQVGPSDLKICYGPDTYMGENLVSLLDAVIQSEWSDERIKSDLHPAHDQGTIKALRDNINVYPSGNCVVHHMFGDSVVQTVERDYGDAYVTAHLEVPGEMFQIALRKSLDDEGVVGSTSNILNFIERKVAEEAAKSADGDETKRLKFILGTEAGMVTSIVRSVQDILETSQCSNVEAEIVFPVSSDAVKVVEGEEELGLDIVPGVSGGEGCSTAGGCATCPFMKMNDIDAVLDIVEMIESGNEKDELKLVQHLPPNRLHGKEINGKNAVELGIEPIVYMREFMKEKRLSDGLVGRL